MRRPNGPNGPPQHLRRPEVEAKKLGDAVEFKVESIIEPTLPMQDRAEVIAMIKDMGLFANKNYAATQRLSERTEQITELISTIKRHPAGTPELLSQAQKLRHRMSVYTRKLFGNEEKDNRWVMTKPGINNRLQRAFFGSTRGTHGPTKTTKEQWRIAKEEWSETEADLLNLIGDEMDAFEKAVDGAGIPWTKGRDQVGMGECQYSAPNLTHSLRGWVTLAIRVQL